MPPWGRPPGGSTGITRREWERQPPRGWDDQYSRFEEIHTEDESDRGVFRDPLLQKGEYTYNDGIYFHGADADPRLRKSRSSSYDDLAYGDSYGVSGEEDEDELAGSFASISARDADDLLVQKAFDRIRRAREQGRTNVNLAREEMDALERRRLSQQPEPAAAKSSAKTKGSGSSSAASSIRSKKKRSLSRSQNGSPAVVRSRGNTKPSKRGSGSASDDVSANHASGASAPGFLVSGPGGVTMYAPVSYSNAQAPQSNSRPGSRSNSRSGSVSRHQRPNTPPSGQPLPSQPQPYHYPRYFSAPIDPQLPPGYRPTSSSSARNSPNLNGDEEWAPRARARARASSSVSSHHQHIPPHFYPADPYPYQYPPAASAHSPPTSHPSTRRHVSGPADPTGYASLRRVPPTVGVSVGGGRSYQGGPGWISEPALRRESGLGNEVSASRDDDSGSGDGSSSSEDDVDAGEEGVLVDIGADDWPAGAPSRHGAGAVSGAAGSSSANSGTRHRKGKR